MNWLYGPDASGTYAISAEPKKHAKGPGRTTAIAWVKDRKTAARIVEALTLMDALSRTAGGADVAWSNPFKADPRIDELIRQVRHLVSKGEHIMSALDDVTAKLGELEEANVARAERAAVDVAELKRLIAEGAPKEDFAPIIARMEAMVQSMKGEDIDPNYPPPAPGGFRSGR